MPLDSASLVRRGPLRRSRSRRTFDWLLAQVVFLILRTVRLLPADRAIALGGWLARTLAPFLPANRIGRQNLRLAMPQSGERERARILRASWDNLGRTAVEYLFLDHIFDVAPGEERLPTRVEVCGDELFREIRESGRPAIIFSAHLANWELLAVCAAIYRLELTVLFRPPNNAFIAERLNEVRGAAMGPLVVSRAGASFELGAALERGGLVGLLVDQHYGRGTRTSFFGQPARTNPMLGILARRFDCPVYGARCIRLPGGRFRLELTGPIELPRDEKGEIDVPGAMRTVTAVVESWVKERPEQWLWLHRRWRAEPAGGGQAAPQSDG